MHIDRGKETGKGELWRMVAASLLFMTNHHPALQTHFAYCTGLSEWWGSRDVLLLCKPGRRRLLWFWLLATRLPQTSKLAAAGVSSDSIMETGQTPPPLLSYFLWSGSLEVDLPLITSVVTVLCEQLPLFLQKVLKVLFREEREFPAYAMLEFSIRLELFSLVLIPGTCFAMIAQYLLGCP